MRQADGPVLGRDLGLDASPGRAVARDGDLAADVDTQPLEELVVGRDAVVDVDEGRRHVAVDGVGVVGRKLQGGLRGGRVAGDRRLDERRAEASRLDQLEHALLRRREENVECFDLRVQAPFAELLLHPAGVCGVAGRADVVRLG